MYAANVSTKHNVWHTQQQPAEFIQCVHNSHVKLSSLKNTNSHLLSYAVGFLSFFSVGGLFILCALSSDKLTNGVRT